MPEAQQSPEPRNWPVYSPRKHRLKANRFEPAQSVTYPVSLANTLSCLLVEVFLNSG